MRKILSVTPYISGIIHHMIFIYSTLVYVIADEKKLNEIEIH